MIIFQMIKNINIEGLHDVMVDVIENRKYSDSEVQECFNHLPEHIQFIALQHGGNDTEFREAAYKFLAKNKETV